MNAQLEEITPKKAMRLLKNNDHNRKLNPRTVNYYAEQMLRGEWVVTGEGISISENGKVLNGQHRLSAIVKAGKPIKMFIFYDMPDSTFDRYDVGKNRSAGDVFFIAGVKNANNVSAMIKHYKTLNIRDRQAEYSLAHLGLTRHELLKIYQDSPDFWQEIHKVGVKGYPRYKLYQTGFLGGFYAHVILDKGFTLQQVHVFNSELFDFVPNRNTSTSTLRMILINDQQSDKRFTPSVRRAFLIRCWNAFWAGKEVKIYLTKDINKPHYVTHIDKINTLISLDK